MGEMRRLSDEEVDLAVEVLKVLFNVTILTTQCSEDEEIHFQRLVSILHNLLTTPLQSPSHKLHKLHGHVINLLIFLPDFSYQQLLSPAVAMYPAVVAMQQATVAKQTHVPAVNREKNSSKETKSVTNQAVSEATVANEATAAMDTAMVAMDTAMVDMDTAASHEFMGNNMDAVVALLEFLTRQLDAKPPHKSTKADLTPILQCMSRVCKCNRTIRKFCRLQVLPYLGREVYKLPEEGDMIRNKLCRLLTHTVMEIKSLAAEFMFILCKENTDRFIKYTGYGNAAGLLAEKGLLGGGGGSRGSASCGRSGCGKGGGCGRSGCGRSGCGRSGCGYLGENGYSSESEDSETEEYSDLKKDINPVTGRFELGETSAILDKMSDREKEQMANDLLNQMDRLEKSGMIKPMRINEQTGKPEAIESVAELVGKTKVASNLSSDSE